MNYRLVVGIWKPRIIFWNNIQSVPRKGFGSAVQRDVYIVSKSADPIHFRGTAGIVHFIKPYQDPDPFVYWNTVRFYETDSTSTIFDFMVSIMYNVYTLHSSVRNYVSVDILYTFYRYR